MNWNDLIEIFKEGDSEKSAESPVQTMNATSTGPSPAVITFLVTMSLSMVLTAIVTYIKLQKKRVPQEIAVNTWQTYRYGYSDSRVNGMHVSSKNVNLRAQTEEIGGYFA